MFDVIQQGLVVFVDVLKIAIPFYLVFDLIGDLFFRR